MTDHVTPEAGHMFSFTKNVCTVCAMPHYVFLSARRPKCGSAEAASVMKRYAAAMGKQSYG